MFTIIIFLSLIPWGLCRSTTDTPKLVAFAGSSIAGIVIGAVLGVVTIIGLFLWFWLQYNYDPEVHKITYSLEDHRITSRSVYDDVRIGFSGQVLGRSDVPESTTDPLLHPQSANYPNEPTPSMNAHRAAINRSMQAPTLAATLSRASNPSARGLGLVAGQHNNGVPPVSTALGRQEEELSRHQMREAGQALLQTSAASPGSIIRPER
jgi:hypothetical protein